MSGGSAPPAETIDASGLRLGIVAARWYTDVTDGLLAGALRAARDSRTPKPRVVRAEGAFELPVLAAALAAQDCDAVVALGAVIRGGTPHFDYICRAATDGLLRVSLDTGVPVGFGLLTCDTLDQALDRAGLPASSEDKGREATLAALQTALTLRTLRHRPRGTGFAAS